MPALSTFLQSPLARHPSLLARKIAERLHLVRLDRMPTPPPPACVVAYPTHWATLLRAWTKRVPIGRPPPFARVYGLEFEEPRLLQLCRQGPQHDTSGLTADIKLIWDYSRGHALFIQAATGAGLPEEGTAFLRHWLEANADLNGPAWICAMEVALRAVNWLCTDALTGGQLGRQFGAAQWAGWIWRHGDLIWRRLEARLISGNHYLADLLGLFLIGAALPEDRQAQGWRRFAQQEFPRALVSQTRPDGGLNEASLRYHAYVTEMALLFRLALGAPLPALAETRLAAMCRIVADFQDGTGDVFALGDDDSGRVLALDHSGAAGRAEVLLGLAALLLQEVFEPSDHGIYPDSGWWIRRVRDWVVALDFGGVGSHGLGAHAHNDDLSICVNWRARPVVVDPGTFIYTGDPAARNRFRSTRAHNTLAVDEQEQRELTEALFRLPGPDTAFRAQPLAEDTWVFTRPVARGLEHRREISVRGDHVLIRDILEGSGRHRVQWRFHLHPAVSPQVAPSGFALQVPAAGTLGLEVSGATPALEILPSEYSPGYGCSRPTKACTATGEFSLPAALQWRMQPLG